VILYNVTGLTSNTTYYYRVRSISSGGVSGNSEVVTQLTYATGAPAYFARMTTQGDTTYKAKISSFIGALESAGV